MIGLGGFVVPPLTAPVVDQGNMLSPATEETLNSRLVSLWRAGGSQIAILTVPSLEGEVLEQISIRVTDAWKLGDKTRDNGVLVLIARDERQLRIEVGQGLEGSLPDAYARRIIDDVITPAFKRGQFDEGVWAGIEAIIQRTDPGSASQIRSRSGSGEAAPMSWAARIFMIVLILFLLFTRFGRTILYVLIIQGLFSRSGRGGGGGGGGGFGGGGGGFSGGGASGKW